jgi:hypothetical protein
MSSHQIMYIKGFNSGYLLAKHIPTLLAKIVKNVRPTNDFTEGLFSGKEEYELEFSRTQLDELTRMRNRSKDRGQDLEQGL